MLELDLLLNAFLEKELASLDAEKRQVFEILLDYPDQVLFDLLMDKIPASNDDIAELVKRIRKAAY
jgi:succinate dehydrogenase flavin-adding protein (antitoxin of CptAB toxin-antitoxin module)